jgi:hypothetical protein
MRLPARIALAEALELITTAVANGISAVAKIRNRLAHGGDDNVTAAEVRSLREAFAPFEGDDIDFDRYAKQDQLRILVAGIWQATDYTVEYALEKRADAELALAAWRKRNALSAEQIAELLQRVETGDVEAEER